MKRYLINGLLALVAGSFAASCTDHDVDYVPLAQQKTQAYDQAFKEMIGGDVDPNQNWGFEDVSAPDGFDPLAAARANTRDHAGGTINVNGNEWAPEDVPAVDDPAEVEAIFNYVNHTLPEMDQLQHHYSTTAPQNLNGYYVTQVRDGMNTDNVYDAFDGTHLENCGEKMNYLQIKFTQSATLADLSNATEGTGWEATGWEHINNFNASFNINHGAATSADFGNTMVVGKGAFDFAYHNSVDQKFHNNWILVDGYYITEDHRYQNFYYVCFDFEGTPECVSKFRFKYNGQEIGDFSVNGAWTAQQAVEQNLEVTLSDGTKIHLGTDIDKDFKSGVAGVYQGLQVESVDNGDKKFDPDDKHTDWIIRITKGANTPPPTTNTTTTYRMKCKRLAVQGRVFCEDLGQVKLADIDFNDVVFDARIWWTYEFNRTFDGTTYTDAGWTNFKYEAEICLLAAGGTITAKVARNNVHDLFKVGETTMVNTYDENAYKENMVTWEHMEDTKAPVTFTVDITDLVANNDGKVSLNLIPIEVLWKNNDSDYNTMQSVGVLNANLGQVPHKICAPIGTVWPSERRNIKTVFPDFEAWATDRANHPEFHNNPVTDFQYTGNTVGLPDKDAYGRDYYTVNDGNIYTNYTWEEIRDQVTYAETETVLWSSDEGYTYGSDGTGAPNSLTLYSTTFNAGEKLRVYGSKQADTGWITFHYDGGASWQPIVASGDQGTIYKDGYIDIPVDTADKASHLSGGPTLYIAAQNYTITKIARLVVSQQ